jgi:hypothetical protein
MEPNRPTASPHTLLGLELVGFWRDLARITDLHVTDAKTTHEIARQMDGN